MMYLNLLALVTVFFTFTVALHNVPVFLLDEGQLDGIIESELDPFAEISQDTFARFIHMAESVSPRLIFFIETELNLMDITSKDNKGTAFPHSRKKLASNKMKMLLQVEDPYLYIKSRFPENDLNKFFLSGAIAKLRLAEGYKHMYIMFEDYQNETRVEQLRRHDSLIHQVYFAIKQLTKGALIAIYTGKSSQNNTHVPKVDLRAENDVTSKTLQTQNQIEFLCENASFVLHGAVQLHKAGRMPPLEPDICEYLGRTNDQWAYDLRLKCHLPGETISYIVQFVFKYLDPNDRSKGWKAVEVKYTTAGIELQTQPLDFQGNWSTWYYSKMPLILNTAPGSFLPRLLIEKYAILLGKKWPRKTTTTTTEPTLQTLWIKEQDDEDRSMPWSILGGVGVPRPGDLEDKQKRPGIEDFGLFALRTNASNKTTTSTKPSATKTAKEILVTPAILMGLFVDFTMVFVFLYGLSMIMGINTNSKYDSIDSKPFFDPDTGKD